MKQEGFLNLNKLFGGIYLITGGVMVGSGILFLAIPSGAERKLEKAYRDYLNESEQRKELALSIGLGPMVG
jgi:hypothetical protein